MVTVKVNDERIKIPERFRLEEWTKLQQWDFDNPKHWPIIIETVTGLDRNLISDAEEESLILFMGFIISAMNKRQATSMKNLHDLNFGQFIDLDCFISLGIDKYMDKMLEILEVETPWATEALWAIEQFIMFRQSVYRKYKDLFGLEDTDFDADADLEPVDPMAVSRGWYALIVDLANNDLLRLDRVTEEPLEKTLTFLQLKKEKALKEAQEMRKTKQIKR